MKAKTKAAKATVKRPTTGCSFSLSLLIDNFHSPLLTFIAHFHCSLLIFITHCSLLIVYQRRISILFSILFPVAMRLPLPPCSTRLACHRLGWSRCRSSDPLRSVPLLKTVPFGTGASVIPPAIPNGAARQGDDWLHARFPVT